MSDFESIVDFYEKTRAAQTGSYRLVLPIPISANAYWRTAVIKGRPVVHVSREAKVYKRDVAIMAAGIGIRKPIDGRVALTIRLYPSRPKDWAKRQALRPSDWDDTIRCLDLDNALKVTLDALKNIAFHDDSWVRKIDAERMEPDDKGARIVVTISPMVLP